MLRDFVKNRKCITNGAVAKIEEYSVGNFYQGMINICFGEEKEDGTISILYDAEDSWYTVYVRDNGFNRTFASDLSYLRVKMLVEAITTEI